MLNYDSFPEDFFFPFFVEIGFTLNPLAVHPLFELDLSKSNVMLNEYVDKTEVSKRFCQELFRKLTGIHSYEYPLFLTYHLKNVVDKREWIQSFILLISTNKDLFISHCGYDNYVFLFEIATNHASALNNAMLTTLHESCTTCSNRVITNIKLDVEYIKHLDGPEKKYYGLVLKSDLNHFENFKNLRFDTSLSDKLKDECDKINILNLFKEDLTQEYLKKGIANIEGLKKIEADCSTGFCAKLISDFIRDSKNENGDQVFDVNNFNLSKWIPVLFHFKNRKQITASSFRDKLPPPRKIVPIKSKPGINHQN